MKPSNLAFFSTLLVSVLLISCSDAQENSPYFDSEEYGNYDSIGEAYFQGESPQQNRYAQYTHDEKPQQPYGQPSNY